MPDAQNHTHNSSSRLIELEFDILARYLRAAQEKHIYHPWKNGMEPMLHPNDYPLLQKLGFEEEFVHCPDGTKIVLWTRDGAPAAPEFILSHGTWGHWGDTGYGDRNKNEHRARLVFLNALATSTDPYTRDAGFTILSMSGYGKSEGKPGEKNFTMAIQSAMEHRWHHFKKKNIRSHDIVLGADSLGTWVVAKAALTLKNMNMPPAILSMLNAFSNLAKLGEDKCEIFGLARWLHLKPDQEFFDTRVLTRHKHRTDKILGQLDKRTRLHLLKSSCDELVGSGHADELEAIARGRGMPVMREPPFEKARHGNVPPLDLARVFLRYVNEVRDEITAPKRAYLLPASVQGGMFARPASPALEPRAHPGA